MRAYTRRISVHARWCSVSPVGSPSGLYRPCVGPTRLRTLSVDPFDELYLQKLGRLQLSLTPRSPLWVSFTSEHTRLDFIPAMKWLASVRAALSGVSRSAPATPVASPNPPSKAELRAKQVSARRNHIGTPEYD